MGAAERFAERMTHADVRRDTRVVAGLAVIYCKALHDGQQRLVSDGAALGAYGRHVPALCDECAAHIRYAEQRRAFCPKDPKPFCAHCDTHCYRPEEAEWQRQMMRFAGPRSLRSRYAVHAIRHALEARKWRKHMAEQATETKGT
jgi:hypothetical protein